MLPFCPRSHLLALSASTAPAPTLPPPTLPVRAEHRAFPLPAFPRKTAQLLVRALLVLHCAVCSLSGIHAGGWVLSSLASSQARSIKLVPRKNAGARSARSCGYFSLYRRGSVRIDTSTVARDARRRVRVVDALVWVR